MSYYLSPSKVQVKCLKYVLPTFVLLIIRKNYKTK